MVRLRELLKCLAPAVLPALPALAQALAFVPNFSGGDVAVIDTSQSPPAVVNTVSTYGACIPNCSNGPEWVAITPDGGHAWVTNGGQNSDNIAVIDTTQDAVVAVVNAETLAQLPNCATTGPCRNPAGIAINPVPIDASGRIYAYGANPPTNNPGDMQASVTVIDVNAALTDPTNSQGQTIVGTVLLPVGSLPRQLSVTPDGTKVWVTDSTGFLWVIDTSLAVTNPNAAAAMVPNNLVVGLPFGVATGDGVFFWVTSRGPILYVERLRAYLGRQGA